MIEYGNSGRNVGILRPPCASIAELLRDQIGDEDGNPRVNLESLMINHHIDQMRTLFEDASERMGVPVNIVEHELYEGLGPAAVMGRKRSRHMNESDILVALNPSPEELVFTTMRLKNPVQRAVITYRTLEDRDRLAAIAASQKTVILRNGTRQGIARMFLVWLSGNDDQEADEYQRNRAIVQRSIQYPDIPAHASAPIVTGLTEVPDIMNQPDFPLRMPDAD